MPKFRFDTRSALGGLTAVAAVCVAAVALVGKPQSAQAFPAYSKKEEVKCGYCHLNAAGGGTRNYRGKYYKRNSLSFASFDDVAEAKTAGVEVAPLADAKPRSLTPPAGVTPAVVTPPVAASPSPVASPAPEAKKTTVAELRKKSNAATLALKKTPNSAAAKKSYSASLTALARAIMDDATIPPAKKYPEALRLSRRAVKFDPSNQEAATDVKRISDVYEQMGKPIP